MMDKKKKKKVVKKIGKPVGNALKRNFNKVMSDSNKARKKKPMKKGY